MRQLSLVLADSHLLMRDALRLLLESRLDCRVVGEAASGPEALALAQELRPDILIADADLPELSGIEVTRTVRAHGPDTKVVVLATETTDAQVQAALRAGALAYVLTDSRTEDLLYAIGQVAAGRHYLSPRLAERALASFANEGLADGPGGLDALTPREREVLVMVAQGKTSSAIAAQLAIGVRTVEWHRARVMHKLGAHSVAEVVRYALRHGLIPEAV
jgi:DNA-binding NarL/FixJ family response regulator